MNEVVIEGTPVNLSTLERRQFCNNQLDSDRCAELIKMGEKRATSSLYDAYLIEGEALPEKGTLYVVVNWCGEEQCIIRVTDVYLLPFNEVNEEHAQMEGEGNWTLAYWRNTHKAAFRMDCLDYGLEFNEGMPVVFEVFEVVHKFA
ncbi:MULTISPECIES: ASCH domain-containing protein [unclassified Vibrio]|nr:MULTISPECIES: ASCH domain-containing protein [unclassified Vibrio]NAW90987.1 ASCH domain-containing protein [Vibrio sp. V24_P1S3T111]